MHWYVSLSLERRVTFRAGVLAGTLVALALALGACGGSDPQDENEAEGTYKVDVISASFPGRQHLAEEATLKITVQNKDSRDDPEPGRDGRRLLSAARGRRASRTRSGRSGS